MNVMVVFSRPLRTPESEEIKRRILNSLKDPLINTSEEIEIILSNLDKRVEERLRRLARRYGYEMEVIK
ncbi:MAG: hypothetical protein J7L59_01550 [Nanoarchaeota archaeon]|nr:hypothetical protein [Nanoarchaeota archaeon]